MPASGMIVWAPLLRKSYFALVSWKQVTNLMAKFWLFYFALLHLIQCKAFLYLESSTSGDLWFIILHPVLRLLRAWGDTPLLPLSKPSGMTWWHQPTDWPPRSSNTKTVRMSSGPKRHGALKELKSLKRVSVLTCGMLKMTSSPTTKIIPILKNYWFFAGMFSFLEDL